MNPRMLVEFVDGSKTMVEMVALANATGLVPDIPGMHGPTRRSTRCTRCSVRAKRAACCRARASSTSPSRKGVAPGVFVVAEMRHPRLRERMNDLQLGEGPYYTFFRPYHLTSLEVPLSAAAAVLFGQSHMRPLPMPVGRGRRACQARSRARRNARCDRRILLSRLRAVARRCASRTNALPLGLAQGAAVTRSDRRRANT